MENIQNLLDLAKQLAEDDTIKQAQIPDIDLYVDQVTTLLEGALQGYKRAGEDKIITKTMINNYTKDKVLPPPVQKKYSKRHIELLIIIYHLKQSLSIGDIMKLLRTDLSLAEGIYEAFTRIQVSEKDALETVLVDKQKKIEALSASSPDDELNMLLLIISLIIDANLKKQLACQILDQLYTPSTGSSPVNEQNQQQHQQK